MMSLLNFKRNRNAKNTHHKMYKSGKFWAFASTFVIAGGLAAGASSVSTPAEVTLADSTVARSADANSAAATAEPSADLTEYQTKASSAATAGSGYAKAASEAAAILNTKNGSNAAAAASTAARDAEQKSALVDHYTSLAFYYNDLGNKAVADQEVLNASMAADAASAAAARAKSFADQVNSQSAPSVIAAVTRISQRASAANSTATSLAKAARSSVADAFTATQYNTTDSLAYENYQKASSAAVVASDAAVKASSYYETTSAAALSVSLAMKNGDYSAAMKSYAFTLSEAQKLGGDQVALGSGALSGAAFEASSAASEAAKYAQDVFTQIMKDANSAAGSSALVAVSAAAVANSAHSEALKNVAVGTLSSGASRGVGAQMSSAALATSYFNSLAQEAAVNATSAAANVKFETVADAYENARAVDSYAEVAKEAASAAVLQASLAAVINKGITGEKQDSQWMTMTLRADDLDPKTKQDDIVELGKTVTFQANIKVDNGYWYKKAASYDLLMSTDGAHWTVVSNVPTNVTNGDLEMTWKPTQSGTYYFQAYGSNPIKNGWSVSHTAKMGSNIVAVVVTNPDGDYDTQTTVSSSTANKHASMAGSYAKAASDAYANLTSRVTRPGATTSVFMGQASSAASEASSYARVASSAANTIPELKTRASAAQLVGDYSAAASYAETAAKAASTAKSASEKASQAAKNAITSVQAAFVAAQNENPDSALQGYLNNSAAADVHSAAINASNAAKIASDRAADLSAAKQRLDPAYTAGIAPKLADAATAASLAASAASTAQSLAEAAKTTNKVEDLFKYANSAAAMAAIASNAAVDATRADSEGMHIILTARSSAYAAANSSALNKATTASSAASLAETTVNSLAKTPNNTAAGNSYITLALSAASKASEYNRLYQSAASATGKQISLASSAIDAGDLTAASSYATLASLSASLGVKHASTAEKEASLATQYAGSATNFSVNTGLYKNKPSNGQTIWGDWMVTTGLHEKLQNQRTVANGSPVTFSTTYALNDLSVPYKMLTDWWAVYVNGTWMSLTEAKNAGYIKSWTYVLNPDDKENTGLTYYNRLVDYKKGRDSKFSGQTHLANMQIQITPGDWAGTILVQAQWKIQTMASLGIPWYGTSNVAALDISADAVDAKGLAIQGPDYVAKGAVAAYRGLPVPANATGVVTWKSSNTDVGTIDPNTGLFRAKDYGKTDITATIRNSDGTEVTATKTITVDNGLQDLTVDEGDKVSWKGTQDFSSEKTTYQWYKGTNPDDLSTFSRVAGQNGASLELESARLEDQGYYYLAVDIETENGETQHYTIGPAFLTVLKDNSADLNNSAASQAASNASSFAEVASSYASAASSYAGKEPKNSEASSAASAAGSHATDASSAASAASSYAKEASSAQSEANSASQAGNKEAESAAKSKASSAASAAESEEDKASSAASAAGSETEIASNALGKKEEAKSQATYTFKYTGSQTELRDGVTKFTYTTVTNPGTGEVQGYRWEDSKKQAIIPPKGYKVKSVTVDGQKLVPDAKGIFYVEISKDTKFDTPPSDKTYTVEVEGLEQQVSVVVMNLIEGRAVTTKTTTAKTGDILDPSTLSLPTGMKLVNGAGGTGYVVRAVEKQAVNVYVVSSLTTVIDAETMENPEPTKNSVSLEFVDQSGRVVKRMNNVLESEEGIATGYAVSPELIPMGYKYDGAGIAPAGKYVGTGEANQTIQIKIAATN